MSILDLLQKKLATEYQPFAENFEQYLLLLKKWNKVFNLTAIESDEELVELHIIDSLSINKFLHGETVLDVGSGAGLPGVPLAIVNPKKIFTLLDCNGKKTRFLTQVKIEFGLKNIEVEKARIEKFSSSKNFSTITCRAFSSLKDFYTATNHLLFKGGVLLAMKGQYPEDEIKQLELSNLTIEVKDIGTPEKKRHLVFIKMNSSRRHPTT